MARPRGVSLLLGLILLQLSIQYGREVFPSEEEPPAFVFAVQEPRWLAFGDSFPRPGVHQLFDGETTGSVIGMALGVSTLPPALEDISDYGLESGALIELEMEDSEIVGVSWAWMPAAQRLVLAIPLRPDAMSEEDWLALPGVGPKLARRIEEDRQKNGEFAALEDLKRVSGIGPGRIRAWEKFF